MKATIIKQYLLVLSLVSTSCLLNAEAEKTAYLVPEVDPLCYPFEDPKHVFPKFHLPFGYQELPKLQGMLKVIDNIQQSLKDDTFTWSCASPEKVAEAKEKTSTMLVDPLYLSGQNWQEQHYEIYSFLEQAKTTVSSTALRQLLSEEDIASCKTLQASLEKRLFVVKSLHDIRRGAVCTYDPNAKNDLDFQICTSDMIPSRFIMENEQGSGFVAVMKTGDRSKVIDAIAAIYREANELLSTIEIKFLDIWKWEISSSDCAAYVFESKR